MTSVSESKRPPTPTEAIEEWTSDERRLIEDTVAKGATPDELKLFLYTAKARGLNPLLKQIYFIKRKQKRGDRWVEVGTIQTGIDGFRLIANRTRQLRGIERGIRREEDGRLYAWARVWRKDWEQPVYEEVSLNEYKGDSPLWHRMPEQMLKKCAEAAALRMAFPEDLSGIYAHEEMDQADKLEPEANVAIQQFLKQVAQAQPPQSATVAETEADSAQVKAIQQAMRDHLKTIHELQKDYGLTKEIIQEVTGLETFKGIDLPALEEAVSVLTAYCTPPAKQKSQKPKKETTKEPREKALSRT